MWANRSDPTARRRLSPERAHQVAEEIIRRHSRGQSIREIARATGMARTSVHRIVVDHRRNIPDEAQGDTDWLWAERSRRPTGAVVAADAVGAVPA